METHARSIAKALTWRVGGLVLTVAVAWIITRRADIAASIGLADTAVKLAAFYIHERVWLKIRFGQQKTPDYEI
jgi:adenylylsulfate kinase